MNNRGFRNKIYVIQTILALNMVRFHAATFSVFEDPTSFKDQIGLVLVRLCSRIDEIMLACFFFFSAFLFFYNLKEGEVGRKLKSRVRSNLIPYVLLNVISFPLYRASYTAVGDLVRGFALGEFAPYMWFCLWIVLFAAVFTPVVLLLKKNRYAFAGVLALLFVWHEIIGWDVRVFGIFGSMYSYINRGISYIPVYLLGAFAGCFLKAEMLKETYPLGVKLGSLAAVLLFLFSWGQNTGVAVLRFLFPLLLWFALDSRWFDRAMGWGVKMPMFLYIAHPLTISVSRRLCSMFLHAPFDLAGEPVGMLFGMKWRFIVTAVTIVLVYCEAAVLIYFLPQVYKLLTGGRIPPKEKC